MKKMLLLLCICFLSCGAWADTVVQTSGLPGSQNPVISNPGVSIAPLVQSPIVKGPDMSVVTSVAPPTSVTENTRLEIIPPKVGDGMKVHTKAKALNLNYHGPVKSLQSFLSKGSKKPAYIPGELLVRYNINKITSEKGDVGNAIQNINAQSGVITKYDYRNLQYPGLQLVKVATASSIAQAQKSLMASGYVSYAEPNYIHYIDVKPNDPRFGQLWGLHNTGQNGGVINADIDAPQAWNIVKGNNRITIAVIDTGVDYNHPDLRANMWRDPVTGQRGYDFVNHDNDPMDDHGHGTHCAGTIAAKGNNRVGVTGVMWNAKIMALKAFDASGQGNTATEIMCILWAKMKGAKITSNSWGGTGHSRALRDVMRDTRILHICAAGNEGVNTDVYPHYPSSYALPNIISVAASTNRDELASFSNFGARSVDVAAPGENILSCRPPFLARVKNLKLNETFTDLTDWTFNHWSPALGTYTSPPQSIKTGEYENNCTYYLTNNKPINLAGLTKPAVQFRMKGKAEYFADFLFVEVTTTGTERWEPVYFVTGFLTRWDTIRFELPSKYAGKTIKLRFVFVSNDSDTYSGYYIDDLRIGEGVFTRGYLRLSGTSMATPHVSGLAGLVYARHPGYSPAKIKSIILNKGEAKAAFKGKMVSGKRINANLAVRA